MGSLKRFNLNRFINQYNIEFLFETGTWKGDSIFFALNYPFKKIYSSEIIEEIANKAKERFNGNKRVEIITASSSEGLTSRINDINGNCIFWLDAHFPGAEEKIKNYNEIPDESIKLPLESEIEIVSRRKNKFQDVILIDDLRIYEKGPYKSGNMPDHILPPKVRNTDFIIAHFGDTHRVLRFYQEEGYLLLLPKKAETSNFKEIFYKLLNPLKRKIY
jgi:hypothetical protein